MHKCSGLRCQGTAAVTYPDGLRETGNGKSIITRQYAQDNIFASHKLVTIKLDLSLLRLKGAIILLAFVISSHTATVCGNDLKILSRRLLQNRWPNAAYICCASLINKHLTLKVVVTSHKR